MSDSVEKTAKNNGDLPKDDEEKQPKHYLQWFWGHDWLGNKVKNTSFLNLNELVGRIYLNNKEIYFNKASSILDNPLNALKWYFDKIIELKKNVKKGSKVSLGSITPLIWITEPINVKASIDGIGECKIRFVK